MVISVGYKYRRGKDTVAGMLRERYGFEIWHWADEVYRECRAAHIVYTRDGAGRESLTIDRRPVAVTALVDIVSEWISGAPDTEYRKISGTHTYSYHGMKGKDGRLLQWWGTDFRRNRFGQDYWVNRLSERYGREHPARLVIPDTRFSNEAAWIRAMDGRMWRVDRDKPVGGHGNRDPNHPSETSLDGWTEWDCIFDNNGTLDNLAAQVDEACKRLGIAPSGEATHTPADNLTP